MLLRLVGLCYACRYFTKSRVWFNGTSEIISEPAAQRAPLVVLVVVAVVVAVLTSGRLGYDPERPAVPAEGAGKFGPT